MSQLRASAGPLAVLAATVGGIAAGHAGAPRPAGEWLAVAAAAAIAAWLARGRSRAAFALVAVVAVSAALALRSRHGLEHSALDGLVASGERTTLVGHLVSDPLPSPFRTRVVVRTHGRHVLVTLARPAASRLTVLEAGDEVAFDGWARPLDPDERARWEARHVAAAFGARDVIAVSPPSDPIRRLANAVRRVVLGGGRFLPAAEGGLVAGFLVGDTRGIPENVATDFRDAGLSHLLAVSGSNVAFVLALVGPVRARLGLHGRVASGLAVVGLFATVTRFEPSVLRASTMAGLSMTAAFVGRPTAGLRLLVVAATVLLMLDPLLVHSVAFRLSCAASGGILLWSAPLARRLPGPRVVREPLATTAAAQLGVAPVLLPAFGSLPLVALPANLLAAPAAGPLTVWGMVAGIVSSLVGELSPEVAELVQVPTRLLAGYVRGVAALAARVPIAVDARQAVLVGGLLALGAGVLAFSGRRSRRLPNDGAAYRTDRWRSP